MRKSGVRSVASLGKRARPVALVVGFGALLAAAAIGPTSAQETLFVGKDIPPEVILDLSALDQLGPPPAAARKSPGPETGRPIVQKPPVRKTARKTGGQAAPPPVSSPTPVPPPSPPVSGLPTSAPPPPAVEAAPAAAAPSPAAAPTSAVAVAKPAPAAPAASRIPPGSRLSIDFAAGAADLSDAAKGELDKVIAMLMKDGEKRVQLIAYAAGSDEQENQALRLSLTRALAVRSYLFDQGVSAGRMNVRALGHKLENPGPADRVDLVLVGK